MSVFFPWGGFRDPISRCAQLETPRFPSPVAKDFSYPYPLQILLDAFSPRSVCTLHPSGFFDAPSRIRFFTPLSTRVLLRLCGGVLGFLGFVWVLWGFCFGVFGGFFGFGTLGGGSEGFCLGEVCLLCLFFLVSAVFFFFFFFVLVVFFFVVWLFLLFFLWSFAGFFVVLCRPHPLISKNYLLFFHRFSEYLFAAYEPEQPPFSRFLCFGLFPTSFCHE